MEYFSLKLKLMPIIPLVLMKGEIMKILILVASTIVFIVGCSTNDGTERKIASTEVQPVRQRVYINQPLAQNNINEFRKYSEAPWGKDQFGYETPKPQRLELIDYKIKKGDTLMLIGQKLYGDYRRWKQIHELNPVSVRKLSVGKIIKVVKPESPGKGSKRGCLTLLIKVIP